MKNKLFRKMPFIKTSHEVGSHVRFNLWGDRNFMCDVYNDGFEPTGIHLIPDLLARQIILDLCIWYPFDSFMKLDQQ